MSELRQGDYCDIKVTRHLQPREKAQLGMAVIGSVISLYNWFQLQATPSSLDNAVALYAFGIASLIYFYHGLRSSFKYRYILAEAQCGHMLWFKMLSSVLFWGYRLTLAVVAALGAMLGSKPPEYELPDNPYANGFSATPEAHQSIMEGVDPSPGFYKQ
ncbi:hypothetical protein [Spongiibacter tropicus]|uniref:hypothetical protein n=1 Tax=Spongiibacter tropicus TaxID=454602 RepID=UPI0035BE49B3